MLPITVEAVYHLSKLLMFDCSVGVEIFLQSFD